MKNNYSSITNNNIQNDLIKNYKNYHQTNLFSLNSNKHSKKKEKKKRIKIQ